MVVVDVVVQVVAAAGCAPWATGVGESGAQAVDTCRRGSKKRPDLARTRVCPRTPSRNLARNPIRSRLVTTFSHTTRHSVGGRRDVAVRASTPQPD
jgi:hypothetical protein